LTKFRDPYGQQWLEVERLPQAEDLSVISRTLYQQRIPHRITEEGNCQAIWVARDGDREEVANLIQAWRRGDIDAEQPVGKPPVSAAPRQLWLMLTLLPVTCGLLVLSLLGYLIVKTDAYLQLGHWFTIVDFTDSAIAGASDAIGALPGIILSEPWRLWTPMFLHFQLLHIAFNTLFLWVFGARIERVMGSWHFIIFVVLVGLAANVGQLLWEGNPRFGGMSGVNYGFIGYIWLRQLFAPHPLLVFPKALIPMLLIMLLLGTVGVLDIFIQGNVANAAHITGLLAGASWGLIAGCGAKIANQNVEKKQ
jgi:GlpG protein